MRKAPEKTFERLCGWAEEAYDASGKLLGGLSDRDLEQLAAFIDKECEDGLTLTMQLIEPMVKYEVALREVKADLRRRPWRYRAENDRFPTRTDDKQ